MNDEQRAIIEWVAAPDDERHLFDHDFQVCNDCEGKCTSLHPIVLAHSPDCVVTRSRAILAEPTTSPARSSGLGSDHGTERGPSAG